MTRLLFAALLFAAAALLPFAEAGKKAEDPKDAKEALQALQEYIGGWKGSGTAEKKKDDIWKETADWSWRFKGKDVWLLANMGTSKMFKAAEMRYLTDAGKYQLTVIDKKDNKSVFEGTLKKNALTLERKNDAGDIEQIKMNIVGGGIRMVHDFSVKPAERTLFNKVYQISYTREGETFGTAGGDKKPECVVTGGLGTMQVSYMGQTYYVCCSGCRDAFNDNPAKIIAEYKKRKAAGQ